MRYTRPLSVSSETRLSPSFLRTTPARKPRTECCCQSVAVIIAAIVAPVGAPSMAIMLACLVSGRAANLGDAGTGRLRDAGLAVFRAIKRVAAFGLVLGLAMGSSEVCATPSAAPPQPRPADCPAGQDPEASLSRSKSSQQRSDQARKPVNSEQDSCSWAKELFWLQSTVFDGTLGEYVAPGPRDATRTVDRLLAILDWNDVVHALDRIK